MHLKFLSLSGAHSMKILTSELIDLALDWAVATSEGHEVVVTSIQEQAEPFLSCLFPDGSRPAQDNIDACIAVLSPRIRLKSEGGVHAQEVKNYSTNWAVGGPIIDREGMEFDHEFTDSFGNHLSCQPGDFLRAGCQPDGCNEPTHAKGPTHLIAAMRCIVKARMGLEIDIPDELAAHMRKEVSQSVRGNTLRP